MWLQTEKLAHRGVKVILMIGGAGGAFTELFTNFNVYYSLLKKTIKDRPWISGVDLDVEEEVDLDNIYKLITTLIILTLEKILLFQWHRLLNI